MPGRNRKLSMSQLHLFGFYSTWIQLSRISFATHIDTMYICLGLDLCTTPLQLLHNLQSTLELGLHNRLHPNVPWSCAIIE
jgi:hypothetical protein